MPWVYLDDHIDEHPKVLAAGDAAFGLWVRMLAYCRRKLTAGRVPKTWAGVRGQRAKLRRLVEVGLLEDGRESWVIHDYERWNHSEQKSRQAREAAKVRWEQERDRDASAHADAQANGMRTHSGRTSETDTRTRAGARAPSPNPFPTQVDIDTHASSSTEAPDDDDRINEALQVVAHRRMERRSGERVRDRQAYMRATVAALATELAGTARAELGREPDMDTHRLADLLDFASTHADGLPPCEACDNTGWTLGDDGFAAPCKACGRVTV